MLMQLILKQQASLMLVLVADESSRLVGDLLMPVLRLMEGVLSQEGFLRPQGYLCWEQDVLHIYHLKIGKFAAAAAVIVDVHNNQQISQSRHVPVYDLQLFEGLSGDRLILDLQLVLDLFLLHHHYLVYCRLYEDRGFVALNLLYDQDVLGLSLIHI